MTVSIENYTGKANTTKVTIGHLEIWFSYETPVAYQYGMDELDIRENDWKQTTGKHLNAIDRDKTKRISGEMFERMLGSIVEACTQPITTELA